MTIAFLIYEYAHKKSPVYGGIGTYFKTMAHELSKKGITVHIYLYSPDFNLNTTEFKDGTLTVTVLKNYFKSRFLLKKYKKWVFKLGLSKQYTHLLTLEHKYIAKHFLSFIATKNIDIIQTHDYLGFLSHLKTPIPKVIRCSGSTMLLTHYFNYSFDKLTYNARKQLEQLSFNNANYITGVSKFTATATQKLFNCKPITVINNGIDIQQFSNNTENEIPFSIFYFGTVRPTKGIDVIARAFNTIIEKEPRATLHIIGRGEDYWNTLCNTTLSEKALKNSTFYGPVIREEMIKMIQKASTFIFPTHGENFPFVFIEAMVLSKPVVVSNIDVSEEIISHNNDGFIAKSEEDYATILLDLFKNDEKRTSIGKNAKNKVLENFTLNQMVNNTIKLYNTILDKQ